MLSVALTQHFKKQGKHGMPLHDDTEKAGFLFGYCGGSVTAFQTDFFFKKKGELSEASIRR